MVAKDLTANVKLVKTRCVSTIQVFGKPLQTS